MRLTPASRLASRLAWCSLNSSTSRALPQSSSIPPLKTASSPFPASAPGRRRSTATTSRKTTAAKSARHYANRGAGGARCLDHGAQALRHHELRRGGAIGDRLCPRRLSRLPAHGRDHRRPRGGVSRVSVERRALYAERATAEARRNLRANGAGRDP